MSTCNKIKVQDLSSNFFEPDLEHTLVNHHNPLPGSNAVTVTSVAVGPCIKARDRKHPKKSIQFVAGSYTNGTFNVWHLMQSCRKSDDITIRCRSYRSSPRDHTKIHCIRFGYGRTTLDKTNRNDAPQKSVIVSTANSDGFVKIYDANLADDAISIRAHTKSVRSLEFGGINDSLMVTCSDDKTAKVWSLPSLEFNCSLVGHQNWVRCAEFCHDASKIATGSDDKTVKLWALDGKTGTCSLTISSSKYHINDVSFHPSHENTLAVANSTEMLLLDLRSGNIIQKYCTGHATVSFSSNGNYLVSSNASGYRIWDLRETRMIVDSSRAENKSNIINCTSFSGFSKHGGPYFASGDDFGQVNLWKTKYLDILPNKPA